MAPWDRWTRRRNLERIERLPTRIASAQPIATAPNILLRGGTTRQPWQEKARDFGKNVGVIRFSFGLSAGIISRCPMVAERLVDPANDRWQPDDDPVANAVLRTYRNPRDTAADLIKRHAWHYQVTGECIQTVEQGNGRVHWYIYSTIACDVFDETRPILVRDVPGGTVFNGGAREVPPNQVNRFWQADEDYPLLATSPMVGIIDDVERYLILGRRTKREAKSALGLNGLIWTPETAHVYPPGPDGKPSLYSQLDQDLTTIAGKSWDDDEALAAVAPFSVHYGRDKDDAVEPKWIDIGKTLDPKILEARQEALECIVRGLPIPNVIGIEGTSGAAGSHWSSWLIEETFFKSAIAPIADPIFHGDLTGSMFRPSLARLRASGQWQGNPEEWRVGYDPTPVIIHPDKAGRSIELYKLGAIKRESVLLETGFGPEDAPSPEETKEWIELQQAIRTARGTMVDAGTTVEAPPSGVSAALAPYPSELDTWLADA